MLLCKAHSCNKHSGSSTSAAHRGTRTNSIQDYRNRGVGATSPTVGHIASGTYVCQILAATTVLANTTVDASIQIEKSK